MVPIYFPCSFTSGGVLEAAPDHTVLLYLEKRQFDPEKTHYLQEDLF